MLEQIAQPTRLDLIYESWEKFSCKHSPIAMARVAIHYELSLTTWVPSKNRCDRKRRDLSGAPSLTSNPAEKPEQLRDRPPAVGLPWPTWFSWSGFPQPRHEGSVYNGRTRSVIASRHCL